MLRVSTNAVIQQWKDDMEKKKRRENQQNADKIKKITENGIYDLLKSLCVDFYKSDYHTGNNKNQNNYASEFRDAYQKVKKDIESKKQFNPLEFSKYGYCDGNFERFIFFEIIDPSEFILDNKNDPESVSNYLEKFFHCFFLLFEDHDFVRFLFDDENIDKLRQILKSDFFAENITGVWDRLIVRCNSEKIKKIKDDILNYLEKSPVISVNFLEEILFRNDFYEVFNSTDGIEDKISQFIKKTNSSSLEDLSGLLKKLYKCRNQKDKKSDLSDTINLYEAENCFYFQYQNHVETLLIDKIAESFTKTRISLETYVSETYADVHKFVIDYLKSHKDKNDERRQKLINGLKRWVMSYQFIDFEQLIDFVNKKSNNDNWRELFGFDDDLRKSFIDSCLKPIEYYLKPLFDMSINMWNRYANIKKHEKDIESFLGTKFSLKSYLTDVNYKSHWENIICLSIWLSLIIICIVEIIACCVLITIFATKFVACCFTLYFIYASAVYVKKICVEIYNDRIYNAILYILKSTSENNARQQLSWDMLHTNKVQDYFSKCYPTQINEPIRND